jgi:hypothetical protein
MPKFRVGQKVQVISEASPIPPWLFWVRGNVFCVEQIRQTDRFGQWYGLDHVTPLGRIVALEEILRPVNDGDSPSTWDQCAWRPNPAFKSKELVHVR